MYNKAKKDKIKQKKANTKNALRNRAFKGNESGDFRLALLYAFGLAFDVWALGSPKYNPGRLWLQNWTALTTALENPNYGPERPDPRSWTATNLMGIHARIGWTQLTGRP